MNNIMQFEQERIFHWEFNIEEAKEYFNDSIEALKDFGNEVAEEEREEALLEAVDFHIICTTNPLDENIPEEFFKQCIEALRALVNKEE